MQTYSSKVQEQNMNLDICITDLFLSALFTLDFKLSYI